MPLAWNGSKVRLTLGRFWAAAGEASRTRANRSFFIMFSLSRRFVADIPVHPPDEIFHVGRVGVAAVMLPPGQLSVQQADIHARHLGAVIVALFAQAARAKQFPDRLPRHRRHIAPLVIQPTAVAV